MEDKSREYTKPNFESPTPQPEDGYWNPPKFNIITLIQPNGEQLTVKDSRSIERFGHRELSIPLSYYIDELAEKGEKHE